jgi:hypothetical protein
MSNLTIEELKKLSDAAAAYHAAADAYDGDVFDVDAWDAACAAYKDALNKKEGVE